MGDGTGQRRRQLVRGLGRIAAIAIACFAVLAGPATAATWTDHQLPSVGESPLFDISCPSTSLCVAVGGGNTLTSSTNPTGPADNWSVIYPGGAGPPNQSGIKGVSCPSPQLCVAVSFEGFVLTSTNPTGGLGAWGVANLSPSGPRTHLYGISCPSPSFCAASAGGAKILTSTDPTGGAGSWTVTQLQAPLELRGISCVSPSFCVAVGDDGEGIRAGPTDRGEILTSINPLGGAWQQVEVPGTPGNLYGVSCPSPALCVTGNALGNLLVSTSPTGPATSWPATPGGGSVQLTAAECPAATRCLAVDNNADVLTSTNPTSGPASWTFTNLIPYTQIAGTTISNAMWGASCPTVTFCAISAGDGQVFTSEDPFAASLAPIKNGGKKKSKRRRKGPKRPRTTLAQRPGPAIESAGASSRSASASSRRITLRFAASPARSTSDRWRAATHRSAIASAPAGIASGSVRLAGAG